MRTIRIKLYKFTELSKQAQGKAMWLYDRYNNPKNAMSYPQIEERLKLDIYTFLKNGEMYNGLTN